MPAGLKLSIFFEQCLTIQFSSSHRRSSAKKMFLKIPQNSQENTVLECLFNKVAGLTSIPLNKYSENQRLYDDFKDIKVKACNFIQKETQTQVFSCKIYEIFNNTLFTERLRWLLLSD